MYYKIITVKQAQLVHAFAKHSKKLRKLSVQPGLRGNNDLRVGRKMATFQLFFFFSPGNSW